MARTALHIYNGLKSVFSGLYLCVQIVFDRLSDIFYPYMWSMDTRVRSLAHVPRHIFLTGGLNKHGTGKQSRYSRHLSSILAGAIDGGIKLFTLYSSRELWHFEETNALLLSLTDDLKRLGYTPFVSLVAKTVDAQTFKYSVESVDSDDEDALLSPLNILLLSPAAKPGNFSRADVIIQLLDLRNAHGSYTAYLSQRKGQDITYSEMLEGFCGLAMDTSGHFIGYPDLYISFSKYRTPQVHNCMPWMLRRAMIFMRPPIRHYFVQSLWRDLSLYNKRRQQRIDLTGNLD